MKFFFLYALLFTLYINTAPSTETGIDVYIRKSLYKNHQGKKVGLISNQTGVNKDLVPTLEVLLTNGINISAIFSPEHGWNGNGYADEKMSNGKIGEIPLFSLYGSNRRPGKEMLKGLDLLIYDIQDIGVRSYTYITTLFYVMEEAAKNKIPVVVMDRPNPINGIIVDGPMLESKWRSFIGYVNVPYCHGMTAGELAEFFNKEYKIKCMLSVIPMEGWTREMSFKDTGLTWIPTSPHIPEADTPLFYASTGIIGELNVVNIGVGYTLPFKVVGAPWINAEHFAQVLNQQKIPGVHFMPYHYRPFYGKMRNTDCHGVLIRVTDRKMFKPLNTQYFILGVLKSLYPKEFKEELKKVSKTSRQLFSKAVGNDFFIQVVDKEQYITWKMIEYPIRERENFIELRKKYLKY